MTVSVTLALQDDKQYVGFYTSCKLKYSVANQLPVASFGALNLTYVSTEPPGGNVSSPYQLPHLVHSKRMSVLKPQGTMFPVNTSGLIWCTLNVCQY